jgi:hypothetical protein
MASTELRRPRVDGFADLSLGILGRMASAELRIQPRRAGVKIIEEGANSVWRCRF